MSASLTSVLGSIILLAPLCFSFSFASAGHSTLEDCIQVTGVPVKMESSDREKWSEKSNLSVASSSMSPVTSMQSHCTYLVSVLAHKQPNKYNRCTNAKVSTCDWIEVRCGTEEWLGKPLCGVLKEIIFIHVARALYYSDTWQWYKTVLREIEELTSCFHLSLYLSAVHSSVISWVSHSLTLSDAGLLFSSFSHAQLFPRHHAEWDGWLKQCTFMSPDNLCYCIQRDESLWLR